MSSHQVKVSRSNQSLFHCHYPRQRVVETVILNPLAVMSSSQIESFSANVAAKDSDSSEDEPDLFPYTWPLNVPGAAAVKNSKPRERGFWEEQCLGESPDP